MKAQYIDHHPEPNRTTLLVSCLGCGAKTFQRPFSDHCDDCKQTKKRCAQYYQRRPQTIRWFSQNGLGL